MTNYILPVSFLIESYKKSPKSCLKVIGNSMFPLLRKGDWVDVEISGKKSLKPGDIILFHNHQRFVVHRIVSIFNDYLLTKGDWSKSYDPPINMQDIIGRVISIQRGKTRINLDSPIMIFFGFFVHSINQIFFLRRKK